MHGEMFQGTTAYGQLTRDRHWVGESVSAADTRGEWLTHAAELDLNVSRSPTLLSKPTLALPPLEAVNDSRTRGKNESLVSDKIR